MSTGLEYQQMRPQRGLTGVVVAVGFMLIGVFFASGAALWVGREPGSRGEIIAYLDRALTAAEQGQQLLGQINAQNQGLIDKLTMISKKVTVLTTADDKQKQDILADLAATTAQINEINKGPENFLKMHDMTSSEPESFSFISTAEAATTNKIKNPPPPPKTFLDEMNDPAHRMLFVIMGALAIGSVFTTLYAFSKVPAKQKFYQTVIINVGTFLAGLGGGAFIAG
ncbi:hypothetical protein [Mesorhizobium sp. M0006]|uniref:hypothetical protein n=1 Tax=unclassified Mesorhizobium TaxID=325217 RepID=UPI003336413A